MEMVESKVESHFFQSSRRWVDIVLLVDDIRKLVDVVIVDPTQTNLVSWVASFSWGGYIIGDSDEGKD
jgi:hypothetical protein